MFEPKENCVKNPQETVSFLLYNTAMKILVIDDHPLMLKSISSTIENIPGFEVAGTFSSEDELKKFLSEECNRREKFLALIDLQIGPDYSFELIKELSKKQIMCAVYSMYTEVPFVINAFHNGARGYIFKNFSEEDFISALNTLVKTGYFIPPEISASFTRISGIFAGMTKKEQQVAELLMQKLSNAEIAAKMNLNVRTVENYLVRLYDKTGCHYRADLINFLQGNETSANFLTGGGIDV